MSDPLSVDHPGAFGSFLRWLGRPKNIVVDALKGNLEGAGRQAGDFLGDIIDAPLPGDWIPELSRPQDYGEASDLAGGMKPGLGKTAVDVLGGIALDPISYVPGGLVAKGLLKGGEAAAKVVKALPDSAQEGIQSLKVGTKSTLGYLKSNDPERRRLLEKANNAKSNVTRAGLGTVEDIFKGTTEAQRVALMKVIQNVKGEKPGEFSTLDVTAVARNPLYDIARSSAENTRAAGEAGRIIPAEDLVKVRGAGTKTLPPDPQDVALGIKGVAPTQDLIHVGDGGAYADEAAKRTLAQTATNLPIDPRFGIPGSLAPYAGHAPAFPITHGAELPPLPIPVESGGDVARYLKQRADTQPAGSFRYGDSTPKPSGSALDKMLGKTTEHTPLPGAKLPNMLEAVNERLGGNPATLEKVGARDLPRTTATFATKEDQLANWNKRIDALDISPAEKLKVKELAAKFLPFSHGQFQESIEDFPGLTRPVGYDIKRESPADYAPRQFSGVADESDLAVRGQASAIKGRVLKENQSLLEHLNAPGTAMEWDLGKVSAGRAAQQGDIARRATIGKGLIGDKFVSLADASSRGAVSDAIAAMKKEDPEGYELFRHAWEGMGQRGATMEALAKTNKVFKPAAVYGLLFPRVGGIMKNILAFPAQVGMTQAAGGLKGGAQQALRTPATVYEAMRAGTAKAFGWDLPADKVGASADVIDQAFRASAGRASNVPQILRAQGREDLAGAVEHGVADGFVSRESVEDSIKNSSWGKRILSSIGMGAKAQDRFFNMVDAPAASFQGSEQYARLGTYLQLLKDGKSPEEAATAVREAMYDYTIKTGKERTLRTLIPFAAFQTNAIRQSAKFMAQNPAAAVGIGALLSHQSDSPVYPYMEGKTNIPLGGDAKGNQLYVSNFGLPFETLSQVPNPSDDLGSFARDIKRSVIGSSHPLVKSAAGAVFGQDPYFETPYGTYDKLPVYGSAGAVGRTYNKLASTGLIQPLTSPLQQINAVLDSRKSIPVRALDALTGASVVDVDPDLAVQQRLTSYLKGHPEVQQYTGFYQTGQDSDTKQLLDALKDAKARIKEKRKASVVTNVP